MTTLGDLTKKLSTAQKRAFRKLLDNQQWQSAYRLQERRDTLDCLVRLGLVMRKGTDRPGAIFFPSTAIEYKAAYRIRQ